MKKSLLCFMTLLMVIVMVVSAQAESRVFASTADITMETLAEAMTFKNMLAYRGAFRLTEMNDEGEPVIWMICEQKDERVILQETVVQRDGTTMNILIDGDDPIGYVYGEAGYTTIQALSAADILSMQVIAYTGEEVVLQQVTAENGLYHAVVENGMRKDEVFIDPVSGLVTEIRVGKGIPGSTAASVMQIEYDASLKPDESIRDRVLELLAAADHLSFSTTDVNGVPVDESICNGAKIIMVNFWESWCGPCVREMPEIEKLYQNLKAEGLLILGVCSPDSDKEEIMAIIEDCGVTYPILLADSHLAHFCTNYVPTTVFFNGDGTLVSKEPYIGAHSYADWEKIVKAYLDD